MGNESQNPKIAALLEEYNNLASNELAWQAGIKALTDHQQRELRRALEAAARGEAMADTDIEVGKLVQEKMMIAARKEKWKTEAKALPNAQRLQLEHLIKPSPDLPKNRENGYHL